MNYLINDNRSKLHVIEEAETDNYWNNQKQKLCVCVCVCVCR